MNGKYYIDQAKMDELKSCVQNVNKYLDKTQNGKGDYFWAFRVDESKASGICKLATLYIRGGDSFSLYFNEGDTVPRVKKMKPDRIKYFADAKLVGYKTVKKGKQTVEEEVYSTEHFVYNSMRNANKNNLDDFLSMGIGDEVPDKEDKIVERWDDIFYSYANWVEKASKKERSWETKIADANKNNDTDVEIFEIEFSEELGAKNNYYLKDAKHTLHKHAKPDMLGIRRDGDKVYISIIEYKCTKAALVNDTSTLPEHYCDMSILCDKIYNDSAFRQRIQDLYNNHVRLMGRTDEIDFDKCEVIPEIVFLFSHMKGEFDMTTSVVADNVVSMIDNSREYPYSYDKYADKVRFWIIPDSTKIKLTLSDSFSIESVRKEVTDQIKNNIIGELEAKELKTEKIRALLNEKIKYEK